MSEINAIKQICSELSLNYRELADFIGYSENAIKQSSSSGNISGPMLRAIELLRENKQLQHKINGYDTLKSSLKEFIAD